MEQDADSVPVGRKAIRQPRESRVDCRSCVSKNPRTLRNNMHENREISCTSWTKEQDRSAKAINRTADVDVCEGSHSGIVCAEQRVVREG
jgi:hypothetical protein